MPPAAPPHRAGLSRDSFRYTAQRTQQRPAQIPDCEVSQTLGGGLEAGEAPFLDDQSTADVSGRVSAACSHGFPGVAPVFAMHHLGGEGRLNCLLGDRCERLPWCLCSSS